MLHENKFCFVFCYHEICLKLFLLVTEAAAGGGQWPSTGGGDRRAAPQQWGSGGGSSRPQPSASGSVSSVMNTFMGMTTQRTQEARYDAYKDLASAAQRRY